MFTAAKQYIITESPQDIDLSSMDSVISGHTNSIADYFLEVEGNDADFVVTAKTSFPSSSYKSIASGTVSSGGGFFSIEGAALASFRCTYSGTFPVTLNIVRGVR